MQLYETKPDSYVFTVNIRYHDFVSANTGNGRMASFLTNPSVPEVMGVSNPPLGMKRRNKDALENATNSLVSLIVRLQEEQTVHIECIPQYVVRAIRTASRSELDKLTRKLESCFCINQINNPTWIDEMLADEFVFACYFGFYFNESPCKVSHRLSVDKEECGRLGVRFLVEEAARLNLKSHCTRLEQEVSKNDTISVLYQLGARPHTIKALEELVGLDCNYDSIRRKWNMYGGKRARGNVTRSMPEHLIPPFCETFWDLVDEGECVFASAAKAYNEVVDINNAPYKIDSFVACLERAHLDFDRECLNSEHRATG